MGILSPWSSGESDVRALDPRWFRRRIAMVSQEPTLFACSIRDNITYGVGATNEQVMSQCAVDWSRFTSASEVYLGPRHQLCFHGESTRETNPRGVKRQGG